MLQYLIISQPVVFIGILAHLTGSTLQDDIVQTGQKLRQLGADLLNKPNHIQGDHYAIPPPKPNEITQNTSSL